MTDADVGTKVALITGAASGIGQGMARIAAARGYVVVLCDHHADRLERAVAELQEEGHEASGVVTDVSRYDDVVAAVDHARQLSGRIDLLVNNAGVEATAYLWEMDAESWGRVIDVNTKGVIHGLRAALPHMLEQGGAPATVVNVASLASIASGPSRQSAYNASKHAVLAATECLNIELAEVGSDIRLHVVLPGPVASRIFTDAEAQGATASAHQSDLDRFVQQEGMTGDEAAALIFAGVDAGAFWITTHPGMYSTFAARRGELLTQMTVPTAAPIEI